MKAQRLLAAAAATAVLTLVSGSPARADSPWSPNASVTPSNGLNDGQVVQVSGTGFQQQTVEIAECGGGTTDKFGPHPVCTYFTAPYAYVDTDASGNFGPVAFPVAQSFNGTQYLPGNGNQATPAHYDCLPVNDCYIRVVTTTRKWMRVDVPITFAAQTS